LDKVVIIWISDFSPFHCRDLYALCWASLTLGNKSFCLTLRQMCEQQNMSGNISTFQKKKTGHRGLPAAALISSFTALFPSG
jgi:hypothetical protein